MGTALFDADAASRKNIEVADFVRFAQVRIIHLMSRREDPSWADRAQAHLISLNYPSVLNASQRWNLSDR